MQPPTITGSLPDPKNDFVVQNRPIEADPLAPESIQNTGTPENFLPTNAGYENVFRCRFWRIDDTAFRDIRNQSYCIHEQWPSYRLMHVSKNLNNRNDAFNMAEYYAAMRILFGEPGNYFDDWKGSFSFAFEVQVFKRGQYFKYGLNVINWRSTVELRFCKVLEQFDKKTDLETYRNPIESEFSAREMIVFDNYLCGCVLGVKSTFKLYEIPPFIKKIDSNLIIFGYVDGEFFEHQHQTQEAFEAEVDKYKHLSAANDNTIHWPEQEFSGVTDVEVKLD